MIRAVIFDFDGVLADTEELHFSSFADVLAEEGIHITRETDEPRFMGIGDHRCFEIAFEDEKRGAELSSEKVAEMVARKGARFRDAVHGVRLCDGSRELIEAAQARGPYTIASCALRNDITAILERHELIDRFPHFVTADELRHSKPDPECFLKALDLLREHHDPTLQPQECLVFEDSFRGVEAAKRASMPCVAVTHSFPAERLQRADWIIDSLGEWEWPV